MWYGSRHFRHPVHPQHQVNPYPNEIGNMTDNKTVSVVLWITLAAAIGLIVLALASFGLGLWEPLP